MFDQLLASTGLHHDVGQLLGDVEFIGSSPSSCPGHAIPDTARWECGSNPANREVVKGFLDKMAEVKGSGEYYTGVYTNTEWDEIVGSGVGPRPDLDPSHPWVLPTYYLWLASWDPTPALLEEQTGDVSNLGFYMFSWQYATDLCQMPVGGDMGAEALATDNGIYIPGWDRWTGGITSSTC